MLGAWRNHSYAGDPVFSTEGNPVTVRIITTNTNDDRGSWMANWSTAVSSGQEFIVNGAWQLGQVIVVYYSSGEFVTTVQITEPGQIITIPAGIDGMRLDYRFWNQIGTARFENVTIEPYDEPTGIDLPDPVEPPTMIPMVGIQWGPYYWLAEAPITPGEPLPNFPPAPGSDEYFTIQGYKIGRNVTFEIIHPPQDVNG